MLLRSHYLGHEYKKIQRNPDGSWIEFFSNGKIAEHYPENQEEQNMRKIVKKLRKAIKKSEKKNDVTKLERALESALNSNLDKKHPTVVDAKTVIQRMKSTIEEEKYSDFSEEEQWTKQDCEEGYFQGYVVLDNIESLGRNQIDVLKMAIANIMYEMGLGTDKSDVSFDSMEKEQNGMKINFLMRLSEKDGKDEGLLAEVLEELQHALSEENSKHFVNSMKRKAKETGQSAKWLRKNQISINKSNVSLHSKFSLGDKKLKPLVLPSLGNANSNNEIEENIRTEGSSGVKHMANVASMLSHTKQKLFKSMNGHIKLKGLSADEFESSSLMHLGMQRCLIRLVGKTGVESNMFRVTIIDVEDVGTREKPRVEVMYRIRLRGHAKEKATAVVSILKGVFADSENRKFFLDAFWKAAGADGAMIQNRIKAINKRKSMIKKELSRRKSSNSPSKKKSVKLP